MLQTILDFLTTKTTISGDFALPNWVFIAVIAALTIILIALIVVSAKGKKKSEPVNAEQADEPAEEPVLDEKDEAPFTAPVAEPVSEKEPEPTEEPAEESVVEEPAKEEEPVKEEPAEIVDEPAEEIMEEPVAEPAEKSVVEETPAPVEEKEEEPAEEVAATVQEEKKEEPKPATKKPAPKKAPAAKPAKEEAKEEKQESIVKSSSNDDVKKTRYSGKGEDTVFGGGIVEEKPFEKKPAEKKEEPMEKKPAAKKAPAAKPAAKKEPEKKPAANAIGKFEICNAIGGFRYLLSANNGQLLYESRDYKSFDSCNEAIDKFIAAVQAGNFRVRGDKFGNYKFHLKSNTSNNIVYEGESYSTKKACENAVGSVQRFAPTAKIIDITEADYVAPASSFEIPDDVKKEVAAGKGAVGKWEIALAETETKNSPYVFLLYANNGQLLYESRDYKTADNCKSGLETFVKTLKDGYFIIDSDKFGRYRFILRKAGNQVEYLGQNYSDKSACTRSAISVYKFGLLTPFAD